MTDNLLVPSEPPAALARAGVAVARLRELRDAADSAAAQTSFSRFQEGCAAQTRRAHRVDLTRFARYLASGGVLELSSDDGPALDTFARDLLAQPALWELLSPGLVELFRQWLLDHGYAIASTNRALATLKTYAGLAFQAGVLPEVVYQQISLVKTQYLSNKVPCVWAKRQIVPSGSHGTAHTSHREAADSCLSKASRCRRNAYLKGIGSRR